MLILEIVCDESMPCQEKLTITCPCGQRKKETRCLTNNANPSPSYQRIECDDECRRVDRNRRLAEALNIDPNSELTDHIPYADVTLKLFKEFGPWAEDIERRFRVFAQDEERSIRFPPMPNSKRQFLHVLAEDFRLESHSEDVEPHRHVVVRKQLLSAPNWPTPSKTLGQCVKIRERQAAEAAAKAKAAKAQESEPEPLEPFNSLLLTSPSFGLTIEDVHKTLDSVLSTQSGFLYHIEFLPSDEILIRATANYAAYLSADGIERTLSNLKNQVADASQESKIAGGVILAHADSHNEVTRREKPSKADPSGWNAVVGRAATKKPGASAEESGSSKSSGRKMLGLKKKTAEKSSEKTWGVLDGDVEC